MRKHMFLFFEKAKENWDGRHFGGPEWRGSFWIGLLGGSEEEEEEKEGGVGSKLGRTTPSPLVKAIFRLVFNKKFFF